MLNKFFRFAFARSGDKAAVPDAVVPGGNVSYDQGYGPDYELPKTNPQAKDIERNKMNQIFSDVTLAIQEYQTNGVPDWVDPSQNGGAPYAYPIGARVRYTNGKIYVSATAANNGVPTVSANWRPDAGRLLNIQTFTASGTYTPTPGTTLTTIEIIGGGGSGCGAAATGVGQSFVGTGGGAAAYARCYVSPAAATPVAITIGQGGAPASGFAANAGGTSSYGTQIVCPGGLGGTGAGPATAPFQVAGIGISGAPAVTLPGATSLATRGAGSSGAFAVGGIVVGSNGAASFFGGGGISAGGGGGDATNYGAGGGGAVIGASTAAQFGGRGGSGVCIIYEYGDMAP